LDSDVDVKKNKLNSTNPTHKGKNTGVLKMSRKFRSVASIITPRSREKVTSSYREIDMSKFVSRIIHLPEIDTARVVELHNRIMADEYAIDANQLATNLMDLESTINFK
tara:strand:+ start:212 stop:538 length:327 start_codon:yes stop_codon:yes gene_type:complete